MFREWGILTMKDKLFELCTKFVKDNHISCEDAIGQCDWIIENANDLIRGICNIVGYDAEDDDTEY